MKEISFIQIQTFKIDKNRETFDPFIDTSFSLKGRTSHGREIILVGAVTKLHPRTLLLRTLIASSPGAALCAASPTTGGAATSVPFKLTIAVTATTSPICLLGRWRANWLITVSVAVVLIPRLLLLLFYLIQSFQSLFILVFVPFH